jgi:hypothetical protein
MRFTTKLTFTASILLTAVVCMQGLARSEKLTGWSNLSGGFKMIYDMDAVSERSVWIGALGGLAHYDGHLWRVVEGVAKIRPAGHAARALA